MTKKRNSPLSVAGLFVGCGGLDYGFQQAGFNMVWANEFSADAAKSYTDLIGHDVVVNDIWNVIHEVPSADVLVGGPPCQSFSLVGKRLDADPRGKLVFAYQNAIERVQPQAFVMENVPGLLASMIDGKRLPLHLAEQFEKMGYEVSILKLVATDFFVPQKRQRVLIVGHKIQGKSFELINAQDFSQLLGEPTLKKPVSVAEALDDLPSPLSKRSVASAAYSCEPHSAYSRLMRKSGANEVTLQTMPTMSALDQEFVRHIPQGGNYSNIPDSVATKRIMSFKASGGRTTTYGRLHQDRPAYTINTYFNRPNVGANYHHREERLITVREAMRLQSFPDHFTPFYSNQRSLHQQIGNAVPPLMARAVAESLKRLFE
jgi:DNA (cytosine-5)-methyltransferase 1